MTTTSVETSGSIGAEAPVDVDVLVRSALEWLEPMQLPGATFCLERRRGDPAPHGEFVRYTLMVYLGLLRATGAGRRHGFDLAAIREAAFARLDDTALVPGDLGLYLWADAVDGGGDGRFLLERLARALESRGGLAAREGMELGWILCGLALQAPKTPAARMLLRRVMPFVADECQTTSGLFAHTGGTRPRRRFPNFATQIYLVHALAKAARVGLGDAPLSSAQRCADRLLSLQLSDGAWPWLFDAKRGRVAEPYELYSVHQHAMAPMALLELSEASGDPRYREAAVRGLAWIHGRNELGVPMVAPGERMIYRSIRRRRGWGRYYLATGAGASAVTVGGRHRFGRRLELNATCCSYELGWLLEAWAGREHLAAGA